MALLICVLLPLWQLTKETDASVTALQSPFATGQFMPDLLTATGESSATSGIVKSQSIPVPLDLNIGSMIVICYLAFLTFRLFRLVRAWKKTRRLKRSAYARELPISLQAVFTQCRTAIGAKDIPIFCSKQITTPVTVGAFRPAIILPETLYVESSQSVLLSAVGHEMAHVRRRDFLLNFIYECIYSLVAFHPASIFIKRRINQTREIACDEMVTSSLITPSAYARALLILASFAFGSSNRNNRQDYSVGMLDGNILEKRIRTLLEQKQRLLPNQPGKILLAFAFFILAASCGMASVFSLKPVKPADESPAAIESVVGEWQGSWNNISVLKLVINRDDNGFGGKAILRKIQKNNGVTNVGEWIEVPLIEPHLNGNTFSFKLQNKENDEITSIQMKIGKDKVQLRPATSKTPLATIANEAQLAPSAPAEKKDETELLMIRKLSN